MAEPLNILARLAAPVPRPRNHLIRYRGILAPNARYRRLGVPVPPPALLDGDIHTEPSAGGRRRTWYGAMRISRRIMSRNLQSGGAAAPVFLCGRPFDRGSPKSACRALAADLAMTADIN